MSQFEEAISARYDVRISTLARIKTRSLGADPLVLSALTVLAYAQLEGGIKDLAACVIKQVNARKMRLGEVSPELLVWRNQEALQRLRSIVNFEMIGAESPFSVALSKQVKIRTINRRSELNQMRWLALKRIYLGFGLNYSLVEHSASKIDDLVDTRNDTAHHGAMPKIAVGLLETQLRDSVAVVEEVLTDMSSQLLTYFQSGMHQRKTAMS